MRINGKVTIKGVMMNWRESLKAIRALGAELNKFGLAMTQDEKKAKEDRKNKLLKDELNNIEVGAIAELYEKVHKVEGARDLLKTEKKNELNSWEASKLQAEMGVTSTLFMMVSKNKDPLSGDVSSSRMKRLWDEAKRSEDKYKIRAFVELLPGVIASIDDRSETGKISDIRTEAESVLSELRETEGIKKAKDQVWEAYNEFASGLQEYRQISQDVGQRDPTGIFETSRFAKALNRLEIKQDEEGIPSVEYLKDGDERLKHRVI